jgi:hypothetical protein
MDDKTDVVAVLGALAWVPQVIGWIKNYLSIPKVNILIQKTSPKITFDNDGTSFSLNMALFISKKETIIEDLSLELIHSKGDKRILKLIHLDQSISHLKDSSGEKIKFENQKSFIAIRLTEASSYEATFTFCDKDILEDKREIMEFLSEETLQCGENLYNMADDELTRLLPLGKMEQSFKKAFWWQPGEYKLNINIESLNKIDYKKKEYKFNLSQSQIEILNENFSSINSFFKDFFMSIFCRGKNAVQKSHCLSQQGL